MAATDNVHMKLIQYFKGLIPGKQEFLDLQENARDAISRIQQRFVSDDGRPRTVPVVTIPGLVAPDNFQLRVANNAAIAIDGLSTDWESEIEFDCKTATHGVFVGDTTPAATQKKYIVCAVKHLYVEADPRVDKDLNPVFYEDQSTTELRVYATSADFALADDFEANATLEALIDYIVNTDFAVPLVISQRRDGTAEFIVSDITSYQKVVYPSGSPAGDNDSIREILGWTTFASILTDNGYILPSGVNAVPGQPGSVTYAGGEELLFTIPELGDSGQFRGVRQVKGVMPAITVDLLADSTLHVIRVRWDEATQAPEVYVGYGFYPDHYGSSNRKPFTTGTPGGTEQGFHRTCVDMPLNTIQANALGAAPSLPSTPGVYPIAVNNQMNESNQQYLYSGALDRQTLYSFGNESQVREALRVDHIVSGTRVVGHGATFTIGGAEKIAGTQLFGSEDYVEFKATLESTAPFDTDLIISTLIGGVKSIGLWLTHDGNLLTGSGAFEYVNGLFSRSNFHMAPGFGSFGPILGVWNTGQNLALGGRKAVIALVGEKADGTIVTQAQLVAVHATGIDDEVSAVVLALNDGVSLKTVFSAGGGATNEWLSIGHGAVATHPIDANSAAGIAFLSDAGVWTDFVSDRRMKKNIEDLPYGIDEVMKMRPRSFSLKAIDNPCVGFIAQELLEVIPEVVLVNDAEKSIEDCLTIQYSHLTSVLCKAIQDQQGQMEEMLKRLAELEPNKE